MKISNLSSYAVAVVAASVLPTSVVSTERMELPITTRDVFIQSGDVCEDNAVVMIRCNTEKPSDVTITYSMVDDRSFVPDMHMAGYVNEDTDFTKSFHLENLNPNTQYQVRADCVHGDVVGKSARATFWTAPSPDKGMEVNFVWAADLAGQGWGRNPELTITSEITGKDIKGGYVIFDVMRSLNPDFAIFQGDMIYADNAIPPEKVIPEEVGGGTWINNPSKDFVAVTLDEFRANWKYNFGDEKMQAFLEECPVYVQWDDHEVTNNWYPGETNLGALYPEGTTADELFLNSHIAFYEFNPILEGQTIYRKQQYGKHLEMFFLDMRTYRDQNPDNSDPEGIAMMGRKQLNWLLRSLSESTATWKIISFHDPVGIVTGGEGDRDSFGQLKDEILGREFEIKKLLRYIKKNNIHNVVSITTDVHFTAAIQNDPSRAEWDGFNEFWEFVVGPINSGAFGPGSLDGSFGPEYQYVRGPGNQDPPLPGNMPPPVLQSFGHASVSRNGSSLTVKLIDITGEVLYEKTLKATV